LTNMQIETKLQNAASLNVHLLVAAIGGVSRFVATWTVLQLVAFAAAASHSKPENQ